jgi:hypothetical protein
MRKAVVLLSRMLIVGSVLAIGFAAQAFADGPSGSTECGVQDDDCDGAVDEDTGTAADDNDGDGAVDEDPAGDVNGDGNPDDDLDGAVDEDPADDDGDGAVDEDPPGDALDDPGENQVDCNKATSEDVAGVQVYAGSNGVEVCSDGGAAGLPEGRVIATTDDGGYVAGDGDGTNSAPADGYARLDGDGLHCGDLDNQDSTSADQSGNTPEDCNAG